ncbi:DNA mismatch repair protein MutL [Formicincola oecophyllae]|uniref:DNA mismatch repair protein MutL n=1 Tax=Formicincola oecophyllae TaxID=2558361 RepID=A0A4Y6UBD6_9PROT|nr:DNA mismatch repair endonuclease MutL [Formicincola oecophyllae]QDH13425.1 DNA mismatch repair protein MutL [Formicincola oecophyllae]
MSSRSLPAIRPVLKRLSGQIINRIAAGEVVERPAAALKELVENALDAGALRIEANLVGGGCDMVEVTDDGVGMTARDLTLAVERHCTSKLPFSEQGQAGLDGMKPVLATRQHHEASLTHITTLGFRGEALPSIGAVARLTITSRVGGEGEMAWRLLVEGGAVQAPQPASGPQGTRVVVRDLFYATPARRKFLKSARVEARQSEAVFRRLAVSAPDCAFTLRLEGRTVLEVPAQNAAQRAAAVLGLNAEKLLHCKRAQGAMQLEGWLAPPELARTSSAGQFFLVNNRPVMDPVLKTAVRLAYRPYLEKGQFPSLVLHLQLPLEQVDVNVHPAKTELRFADEAAVRSFVINALEGLLGRYATAASEEGQLGGQRADQRQKPRQRARTPAAHASSQAVSPLRGSVSFRQLQESLQAFQNPRAAPAGEEPRPEGMHQQVPGPADALPDLLMDPPAFPEGVEAPQAPFGPIGSQEPLIVGVQAKHVVPGALGIPVMQLHEAYILSMAPSGDLILTDQMAACERLAHEGLLPVDCLVPEGLQGRQALTTAQMEALLRAVEEVPNTRLGQGDSPLWVLLDTSALERFFTSAPSVAHL